MLPTRCEGGFVERGDNLLAFGLLGRGKTRIVCAIGHERISRGLFTPTFALVQRLLAAKKDLRPEKDLAAADDFDPVIRRDHERQALVDPLGDPFVERKVSRAA